MKIVSRIEKLCITSPSKLFYEAINSGIEENLETKRCWQQFYYLKLEWSK